MALFRILLLAFILSGVFKFVTRILIPILRMRSAVKDQIKTQQQAQTKQNQKESPKTSINNIRQNSNYNHRMKTCGN